MRACIEGKLRRCQVAHLEAGQGAAGVRRRGHGHRLVLVRQGGQQLLEALAAPHEVAQVEAPAVHTITCLNDEQYVNLFTACT